MENVDPNLDRFEKYLNGELSPNEVSVFENELKDNPEFLKAFESHKNLRKGIEWASISNSLEQIKRIHKSLEDEDLQVETEFKKQAKVFTFSKFQAMAATLLLGILATTIYFKVVSPTPDELVLVNLDPQNTHLLYGSGGENVPLIDMLYPVKIESSVATETDPSETILIQLFASENEAFVIDTTTLAVVLFTPYPDIVEAFEQKEFVAIYNERTDDIFSSFHLISEKAVFSLPMPKNIWTQLTKR